ncbi:putative Zinc finger, Rad18-type [Lupinus albus]|uniref:Putative Zinc finger, Rad18-type n=1 Tax=Lupinus albus TaxID=3870 RepID=A0A6A4QJZ5_LUPAL|nr:putative Zinc finger, Rad18-type [Lupinus albus]
MSATSNGFSIRDYTYKMRSINVFNSWPFLTSSTSSNLTTNDLHSSLPPFTKSNLIQHKSDKSPSTSFKDDDKFEMLCPVCRQFNAATLTAVNAHIDSCLALTNSKSKSKPLKKRSIAEIFRVHEENQENSDTNDVSVTVTKFNSLSRRLEALRSNRGGGGGADEDDDDDKLEMVCPVCRDFNAATVTAVNAHIDSCLARAVRDERRQMMKRTSKPKAPKKRSIAEILTVAPPIQATKIKGIEVREDNSGDSSGEPSDFAASDAVVSAIKSKKSTSKSMKKKKTKKKSKVGKHCDSGSGAYLNNRNKKKRKKMKKSKSFFNDELSHKNKSCLSQEDAYKSKVQSPVYSFRKLKGIVGNKVVALHDIDSSIHKKKLGSKILLEEQKQKDEDCESVGKQLKEVSPAHGILKNHLKQVSGNTSSGCCSEDGAEESDWDDLVPTSDRHVRFAGKEDPLGPKKRVSFETMFNKSSDLLAASFVKEQWSGSDEETASLEGNINYDQIAIDIKKRKEVCPIVELKQFYHTLEQVTIQDSLKPCINQEESRHSEDNSESLTKVAFCDNDNLHLFDESNTSTPNCSPYADISRPSTVEDVQVSGVNTDECESGSFSSIGKFIDSLENTTFQVAANTRSFLESSSYSASYDQANERPEFPLRTYGDIGNRGQALGERQLSHMFTADVIDNSFPFTGWGKGSVRSNCLDPNFFGLPLNSQGELINFSSSGKLGMNQPETSSTSLGSSSGLPVNDIFHLRSLENLSIKERDVVQKTFPKESGNQFPHYPARLAVTALQSKEREDIHLPNSDMCSIHYVHPLNSELNLMRNTHIEQIQSDQIQNPKGIGTISLKKSSDHISPSSSQPTVRLMGKDVPIGRSSEEIQEYVGYVRADEESRRRHHSKYAAIENSSLGRCSKQDSVSGSPSRVSTENVLLSGNSENNQASQRILPVNGPNSEFPYHISQNGSLAVSRNACSYSHSNTQEPTSCAVFKRAPDYFEEQSIPGAKTLGFSSRSQVLTTDANFSQLTCLSIDELNDRNRNPHVTKSAFEFPFSQPAVHDQAKTSWFQRPYRSSSSWLSSSTDERRVPVTFTQQASGASSQSFPPNFWGNNFTAPPENRSREVIQPYTPLSSLGPMKTPLCPTPIAQPRHVPFMPSTINNGCRNTTKLIDRMKLDNMTTKDHHHPCTNTRKRPAINFDDSRKPMKLPNIEMQEILSRKTRVSGESSGGELQQNTREVELDPQVDSARSRRCQNEAQNLHPTSYPAAGSFKLHGAVKSGLGDRHILRFS